MRLAHVTTVDMTLRFLLRDQLSAFRDAGFDMIAISAPGPWVPDLERDGVTHVAVSALKRRLSPVADVRALLSLIAVFRRLRPCIVHTHTPKASVLGRIAARLAGVPIVVDTVHGFYAVDGSFVRRQAYMMLERLAARCADFEFCQSREDLEGLRRLGVLDPARSAYLGNGVNLQLFDPRRTDRDAARAQLGVPPGAVVVGTVGRLVWEKGYREFFAMAEVLKKRDARLVVLAIGPHEAGKADAVPVSVIEDLERRGVVRFLGMRTDMPALYAAMDIFVLASYREGLPRAAVEAAAMGKPLVLTNIRGCRETAVEGRNGFLVPPRDVPHLLDRVWRLVCDARLRNQFGMESRERALDQFDEQRVISTTLDVYRRLLWKKRGVTIGAHQESAADG